MRWTLALLLLAAVPPATADLFTVGPGGTHSSVQLAVINALARGGSHEIRVAQGRWRGQVRIAGVPGDALRISGGWNTSFSVQTGDAESTRIDSGGAAPVLDVDLEGAAVTLSRLTITGARTPPAGTTAGYGGGGLNVRLVDGASLELHDTVVRDNHLVYGGSSIVAAGLNVSSDASTLTLRDCAIEDNSVTGTGPGTTAGAAAALIATAGRGADAARTVLLGNRFSRNRSTSPEAGFAPSLLYLGVSGNATGELTENSFADNVALEGAPAPTAAALVFVSGFGSSPVLGRVEARRNNFQDNRGPGPDAPQLAVSVRGGEVELTDGLVVRGDGGGVRVDAASASAGASSVFVTNLTVTGHPGFGLERVAGDGQVYLSNAVLFGNGADLVGSVDPLANLVGVDPRFLDPSRDYRLRLDSPGIDTGDTGAPGGLGPLDILGGPRVLGSSVDVGAFEADGSSGDGTCRALWPLVDRYTPACRCATDPGLRALRCAFFGPEIIAVMRTRLPPPGGRPFKAEWSLLPWTPVVGRYQMDAAVLVNGKWVEQAWLGPTAPRLTEGELVSEPFLLEASPAEPTWLRTRLRYRPRGQKPVVAAFEILLPAPDEKPGQSDQP